MESTSVIGRNIQRVEATPKASGQAKYAEDWDIEGALHLKVLRSTVAHAKVNAVNVSEALKVPGVIQVFTADHIPGLNAVGRIKKDQPVLVKDRIRMVGDPIALVAAVSPEAAEAALGRITVNLEPLKAVFDPEEALEPNAPQIHDDGNVLFHTTLKHGNVADAFAKADIIIENDYQTARNDHAYIEPEAALGYIDDEGRITILSPHQHPHQVRDEVQRVLDLPSEQVRIIHTVTGGGFGGKIDVCLEAFIGLALYYLKKPVKMVLSRPESLATTSKRLPIRVHYRTAARKDGKLLGAEVKIIADNGAYAYSGSSVIRRAVTHAIGPYELDNLLVDATTVYTNNIIGGQMRGFGVTEIAIAHESQMNELARTLGIDPIEIRIINGLKRGSKTITGQDLPESVGLISTLEAVRQKAGTLENFPIPSSKTKGIGVASMYYGIGKTGKPAPSTIRVCYSGDKVTIYTGAAEIGQGSDTVLKQMAATAFELPVGCVEIVSGDTGSSPDSGPSSASQQTFTTGNAICLAADRILSKWGQRPANCDYIEDEVTYIANTTIVDLKTGEGRPYESYAFATHLAEVLVDKETGQVDVIRIIAAHDVGKAINPVMVEGQIEGGVVMGIGMCLMESYRSGATNSFREYIMPTTLDFPEIIPIIVEDKHPLGPFGAKGVGEPSMIPSAPAILSAIYDAVGVKVTELPCTAEKIFFAQKDTREERLL